MKFDFIIGNPPYQEESGSNGRQPPIYDKFMEEAYKISDCVELITPARFLFNGGQTPKEWNRKMLNDPHLKVIEYRADASTVFPNTEIKGGVAITLRDNNRIYGAIGTFTSFVEMDSIIKKVSEKMEKNSISSEVTGAVPYRFTDILKSEHPEYVELAGKSFDVRTNALDNLADKVFFLDKPDDGQEYVRVFGLFKKKRTLMWIDKRYLGVPQNFDGYKVLMSKANGSGKFGEALSDLQIVEPMIGHTQSFISIGNEKTYEAAISITKYVKTKFFRALLGVLKTTQDITPSKMEYIPKEDFTPSSDILWDKTVDEIDKQLFIKYGLDSDEISFINTHVKEMA